MPARTLVAAAALVVLPSSSALAQMRTWVVDAAGGSGHHFRTIQAGVTAAADGDTVLVRPGSYAEQILVDGKGLFVVALPGTSVFGVTAMTPAPMFHVRNLPATSVFEMRALQFTRLSGTPGDVLRLESCAGRVWIEQAFCDNYDGAAVRVEDCAEVLLSFLIAQSNAAIIDPQGVVQPAVGVAIARSRVRIFDLRASGSHTPPVRTTPTTATRGGAALTVHDARVELTGVELRGGSGGAILVSGCAVGAIGGSGLEVDAPLGLPTSVSLREARIDAGITGSYDPGCAPNPGTAPAIRDPLQVVTSRPGAPRVLIWPTTPYPNGNFEFRLHGGPGDLYLGLLALDATPGLPLSGVDGELCLPLASCIIGFQGRLDPQGWSGSTAGFASIGETFHVHAQAVLLDAAGGAWLSNPAAITFH